jgi:multiple antibiotic resistance protein
MRVAEHAHRLLGQRANGAFGRATALTLRAAEPLKLMLGETGIEVSTRISGILVTAIAVGMIVDGISRCFPVLVHG